MTMCYCAERFVPSYQDATLCFLGLSLLAGSASAEMEGIGVIDHAGERRLAAITRLPDGRLMGWWTEGEQFSETIEDADTVERAFARYSSDNDCTWPEPEHLLGIPKDAGLYGTSSVLLDGHGGVHLKNSVLFSSPPNLRFQIVNGGPKVRRVAAQE